MARTPDDVPITEDEFEVVYEAIRRNTTPYSMEEVPEIVAQMREARKVLERVRDRAGLDDVLPPVEDDPTW
jgi:hypothetical protein